MNNENGCMLKEITSFLIRVGEHCLECEEKTIESKKETILEQEIKRLQKYLEPIKQHTIEPKIKKEHTYLVPTDTMPSEQDIKTHIEAKKPVKTIKQKKAKKGYIRNKKVSYLEKWIANGVFEVFTLDQFYKAYPLQRKNRNLDDIVLRLLKTKKIGQLSKNKYMVVR